MGPVAQESGSSGCCLFAIYIYTYTYTCTYIHLSLSLSLAPSLSLSLSISLSLSLSAMSSFTSPQAWLTEQLSKSTADWQLAVTHFPCGFEKNYWAAWQTWAVGRHPCFVAACRALALRPACTSSTLAARRWTSVLAGSSWASCALRRHGLDLLVTGHRHDQELWSPNRREAVQLPGLRCLVWELWVICSGTHLGTLSPRNRSRVGLQARRTHLLRDRWRWRHLLRSHAEHPQQEGPSAERATPTWVGCRVTRLGTCRYC